MSAPYQLTPYVWMVPCKIASSDEYTPVNRPSDFAKISNKLRQGWENYEDLALVSIVKNRGPKNWSSVAKELNSVVHHGFEFRIGKQCRERWLNHLNPEMLRCKWDPQEDLIIIQKQAQIGNKWCEISKFLVGRTENQIKNRWKILIKTREFFGVTPETKINGGFGENFSVNSEGNRKKKNFKAFQKNRKSKDQSFFGKYEKAAEKIDYFYDNWLFSSECDELFPNLNTNKEQEEFDASSSSMISDIEIIEKNEISEFFKDGFESNLLGDYEIEKHDIEEHISKFFSCSTENTYINLKKEHKMTGQTENEKDLNSIQPKIFPIFKKSQLKTKQQSKGSSHSIIQEFNQA